MASGDASNPHEHQTCVLKVSIHCEGCKKKVKKILKNIGGVYDTHIDAQQHKVVVTGDVDADTLIRKLQKANKHAELWPEKKPNIPSPSSNSKSKSKTAPSEPPAGSSDKKPPADAGISDKKPPKNSEPATKSMDMAKSSESSTKIADSGKTNKEEAEKIATKPTKPKAESFAAEKAAEVASSDSGTAAPATGGGKKKGKKEDSGEGASLAMAAATSGGPSSPPRHHQPPYEHLVNHQPQPVHAYSMAHPSASYSYYAPPPAQQYRAPPDYHYRSSYPPPPPQEHAYRSSYAPPPPQEYAYRSSYPSPPSPPPQSSCYSPYSAYPPPEAYNIAAEPDSSASSSQGSYDMFSDENPNSCKVM